MKNKQINFKIFFLLFVFFITAFHFNLKAQNITTYYTFGSEVMNPSSLKVDASGNFYFINYDNNWQPRISKLSPDGIISNIVSGGYNPQKLSLDNVGNIFFRDDYTWPFDIKKVTPDGTVSLFASGDFYPEDITFNAQGDMYFSDSYNYPPSIKKVNPDGTISTFLSDPEIQPVYMAFDKWGTLYFSDWSSKLNKRAPDGTVSDFGLGNYGPQSLTIDSLGNLYFIDFYYWPYDIKKITPDGTVSIIANVESSGYIDGLTVDHSGSLYYISRENDQFMIKTVQNPAAPCAVVPSPAVRDTAVCYGNSLSLSVAGFGEIRWYDAPSGGNLVNTGTNFTTGILITTTSFYIESYFCNVSTGRTELKVTVNTPPTITITGNTKSIGSVTLTASGGTSYLWSGGSSKMTAQNTFTASGTYIVAVWNEGCVNTATTRVIANAVGINKYGNILSDGNDNLNDYGAAGAETKVDRYGKKHATIVPIPGTNNGLSFDGSNDFAALLPGVYFNGDFTVECWVYPRSFGNWARIFDFGNGQVNSNVVLAYTMQYSGKVAFHTYLGSSSKEITAPNPLPLNKWSHIAVTLNGTTATMYVNGIAVSTAQILAPANIIRNNAYIGKSNWPDAYANAIFDEFRIWNKAKSVSEILGSMNKELAGNEQGLVVYYNFNQGKAGADNAGITTLTDNSGNGNHATLNNFSLTGNTSNWVEGAPVSK